MKNNRWCSNVERAHKSNGIYYVGESNAQQTYDPASCSWFVVLCVLLLHPVCIIGQVVMHYACCWTVS
jgi:hypothetical protein